MWEHEDFIPELDFVLELNGDVIGNIMYTKAKLTDENGCEKDILTFGPVSIHPAYQRMGYGKMLMEHEVDAVLPVDGRKSGPESNIGVEDTQPDGLRGRVPGQPGNDRQIVQRLRRRSVRTPAAGPDSGSDKIPPAPRPPDPGPWG